MPKTFAITLTIAAHTLGLAGSAAADPCDVHLVRVPDAIRARVEAWIQSERHCTKKLEVRIVESRSGYYVFASDARGRVHERVVPDADSAGVLVASWAADDSIVAPSEFDVPPVSDAVTVTDADDDRARADFDDERPAERERRERAQREYEAESEVVATQTPRATKYVTFEAVMGDGGRTRGVRAEVDLYAGTHWTFGVAGQISATETNDFDNQATWHDQQVTAFIARTFRGAKWSARFAGGIGITHATGQLWDYTGTASAEGNGAVFEWSFLLGREVSANWSLTGGFIVQHYAQTFVPDGAPTYAASAMDTERSDVALSFLGGVRYAL